MTRYSDDYDRSDAASDAAADARDEAIKDCIAEVDGFAWRWRIVESASAKLPALRVSDPIKAKSLARRIKHLDKWCEEAIEEWLSEAADAAHEARDPYGYRGLSRKDFY
jgi:hypothetical protein